MENKKQSTTNKQGKNQLLEISSKLLKGCIYARGLRETLSDLSDKIMSLLDL